MKTIILIFLISLASVSMAEEKALTGTYEINSGGIYEPGKKSHMLLRINGEAAKELYNTIKSKEKHDECSGLTRKNAGNIYCISDKKTNYSCQFSINIKTQVIESDGDC